MDYNRTTIRIDNQIVTYNNSKVNVASVRSLPKEHIGRIPTVTAGNLDLDRVILKRIKRGELEIYIYMLSKIQCSHMFDKGSETMFNWTSIEIDGLVFTYMGRWDEFYSTKPVKNISVRYAKDISGSNMKVLKRLDMGSEKNNKEIVESLIYGDCTTYMNLLTIKKHSILSNKK